MLRKHYRHPLVENEIQAKLKKKLQYETLKVMEFLITADTDRSQFSKYLKQKKENENLSGKYFRAARTF